MAKITMKRNDTSPAFILEISTPGVSLQGASCYLIMSDGAGGLKINRRAVTPSKYDWDSEGGPEIPLEFTETDTGVVGTFPFEIEVNYGDGSKETFPNSGYHEFEIIADLG